MSAPTVADALLERLRAWGVEHVFGYPGDGINGIVGAFSRAGDTPRFLQARHEEMSAFEAVGYAKFSDAGGAPPRVGVCLATSGPGAIHLLNGLYDAKLDHVPVVAIVGQTARTALGGSYQQEVDLPALFADVASEFCVQVTVPEQLPNAVDRAMRTALGRRVPTVIVIPADVQELPYEEPAHAFKMVPSSLGVSTSAAVPPAEDLQRAADVLNAGSKVAILVGQGARGAAAEVAQVADLLGAGVAKALLGKDVLSDEEPWVTGAIGLLGTRPSYDLMRDCDTLLTIGSSFPYSQFLPEPGQARGVQIDADPGMVGMRHGNEVNLVGDAAATLRALLPLLRRQEDRGWREDLEAAVGHWHEVLEREAEVPAKPVNPMRIFSEFSRVAPADALVTSDSGSAANWYARHVRMRAGMRGSLSGTLASMGAAVPYAIGAKFAHPGRPAIAFEGDGAMQMNGMAELLTIARYWQEWEDPRLVVAVLHNNDLNEVTWELRAMGGTPQFVASQALPDMSYAGFAASVGLGAITVTDPDELAGAWAEALSASRPYLLDVHCDPDVPPIPPHTDVEQALNTAKALLKGDTSRWGVFREGLRTKAQELLS